jgi:hypothetical protein
MNEKHTKKTAGRLGGLATVARHGKAHMQTIGKSGAVTTWQRYELQPAGLNGWAMVDRKTGKVKATIGAVNF